MILIVFFIELLLLCLISRGITRALSRLIHSNLRSVRFTIYIVAVLLFPGTILHEVSHALFAGLLGVQIYSMEFMPKLQKQSLRLGSVQIATSDFIRRTLIGIAPLLVGMILLLVVIWSAVAYAGQLSTWHYVLIAFLIFQISNTMFPSKEDLRGSWKLFLLLGILSTLLFYLAGAQFASQAGLITPYLTQGAFYLGGVIVFDLLMLTILYTTHKLLLRHS